MRTWIIVALVACRKDDGEETGTTPELTSTATFTAGDCFTPIDGAACGTVTLPALHGSDDGRTITLSTAVLPATSGAAGTTPLVLFNGGPGSSVFDLAGLFAPGGVMAPLGVDHDVVLMSERGTPGATPLLDCPELSAVDAVFTASAEDRAAAQLDAWQACRDRLVAGGVDLDVFDGAQRAADVPVALRALGYDRWHLWGVSGGAALVQRVVREHPEGVASAHVDSGGFPTAQMGEVPIELLVNVDSRYQRMFDECAADPVCGAQYPTLAQDLVDVVAGLEASPVPFTITHPVTGVEGEILLDGDLFVQVLTNNFASIQYLPLVITLAKYGDLSLVEPSLPAAFVADTGPSFADGLYQSVACADFGPLTIDDVRTDGVLPELSHALLPAVDGLLQSCALWDVPTTPPPAAATRDVPILIMEGLYDTNRPSDWGRAAAEGYTTAYLAEFPNHAHVVLDDCAVAMMAEVMADPTAPPDMSCIPDGVEWVPLY